MWSVFLFEVRGVDSLLKIELDIDRCKWSEVGVLSYLFFVIEEGSAKKLKGLIKEMRKIAKRNIDLEKRLRSSKICSRSKGSLKS